MPAKNPSELISRISDLVKAGMTNPEIAKEVGKSTASVNIICGRFLGGNPNYLIRKTKHKHLQKELLLYFLTHTQDECMKHFKLTKSEMKSCLTLAYRNKETLHIRKDGRNHNPWTADEMLIMLKYSGILRRSRIGKLTKRGSERTIKEKYQHLNVSSRNINGANISQFRHMFGYEPKYQIRGEAGPGSFGIDSRRNRFVIVPWAYVVKCYAKRNPDETMMKIFEAYALFQRFVWKGDPWKSMLTDKNINKYLFVIEP